MNDQQKAGPVAGSADDGDRERRFLVEFEAHMASLRRALDGVCDGLGESRRAMWNVRRGIEAAIAARMRRPVTDEGNCDIAELGRVLSAAVAAEQRFEALQDGWITKLIGIGEQKAIVSEVGEITAPLGAPLH